MLQGYDMSCDYVLLTSVGTLVYFDHTTRSLCHGPIGSSPRNVFIKDTPDNALDLTLLSDNGSDCVHELSAVQVSDKFSQKTTKITIKDNTQRDINQSDSYLTLYNAQLSLLLPLSLKQVDLVVALLDSSWFMPRSASIIQSSAVSFGEEFQIIIGDMILHLDSVVFPIVAQDEVIVAGKNIFRSLDILYDRWKLERLEMFSPLVYMTVFGAENFFKSAELTISSLERIGCYAGDYIIITDATGEACLSYFGNVAPERIHHLYSPATTFSEMVAERLKVDPAITGFYQPVVYLDSDVICDAPLEQLLIDIMSHNKISFATEFPRKNFQQVPDKITDWFGRFLSREDTNWDSRIAYCINSGIFGARNVDVLSGPFKTTLAVWEAYREEHDIASINMDFEQPFMNYVLQKSQRVDLSILDHYAVCVYDQDPMDQDVGRGFVHFNSGVGSDKFQRMSVYLSHLFQEKRII